ncbi:ABC transporter permease [Gorillibacterium timonense]|uniref:ABC transporter permease n=1 Tax=Gorillibacterium timonense TaxID=1689269 RepID=UPI00071CF747|nr:ABC transporter permease [Gorillibacterium timonense]
MSTLHSHEDIAEMRKKLVKEQRGLRNQKLRTNYALVIGAGLLILLLALALLGPFLTSYSPNEMKIVERLKPPGAEHLLGTDEFGRDLLTRLVYGAQVSMSVGLAVALISSTLGLIIGLYASYYRALDHILMRICDGLVAIPAILLAIALMSALGASALNVIIALTVVFTPNIARVVRSRALVVREQTYIEAIKSQGAGASRIIWGHIAPNTLSILLVQATFVFAEAIISEAALSFLGVGIPAPAASWGNILQAGKLVIYKAWWMVVFPGTALILSVLALNLLGDGLRDYWDPHIKPQRPRKWSLRKKG